MVAKLPWKVIVDILSRLSVRDLLRYRCVAKPWCSLIDGPDFIKKHLDHAMRTASNLGVVIRECDLHWMSLDFPDLVKKIDHPIEDGGGAELLGSCNGLLALLNIHDDVALWNPTTRRYRKLPNSDIEFPPGFFPCVQYIIYGFGHDPIGDDYKLVRLIQFYGGNNDFDSEVKVYSAKTDSWKRIRDFPYYLCYKRGYGVLACNALHWVVSRNPESDVRRFVVAFDLATEQYREVPMPRFVSQKIHMNVDVLGGSLCVLFNYPNDDPNADWDSQSKRVDVWMMKEYGVKESWTRLFSVVPTDEIGAFSFILPVAYLSAFGDGRQILLNQSGKKFITYDLETERAEDAEIYSTPHLMETVVCVESLVRLDGGKGQNGWKKGVESKKKKKQKQKRGKKKQNQNSSDDFLSQGFKLEL